MDRDGLASSGDVEADLVFELGGDPFAAEPLDLLDVEFGEELATPKATTSAGQWPLQGRHRGRGERGLHPSELGHRGLRQVATSATCHSSWVSTTTAVTRPFDRSVVREHPDHVGAPLDLSVESLEGVRRPDLAPVGFGNAEKASRILFESRP